MISPVAVELVDAALEAGKTAPAGSVLRNLKAIHRRSLLDDTPD